MILWKRDKLIPKREIIGNTHGLQVTRVQFNKSGGFKLTGFYNDKEQIWWVPTDPGNAQVQWIRQWMLDGGFPEDPDRYPKPPRFLFVPYSVWKGIGSFTVGAGTILAGIAAAAPLILQACK